MFQAKKSGVDSSGATKKKRGDCSPLLLIRDRKQLPDTLLQEMPATTSLTG